MSMEWGSPKRRGLMASWPQLGVPIGLLLSTAMIKLMSGVMSEDAFAITFLLTYGTEHLDLPKGQLLNYTLVAAALGLVSVPFFGHLSDLFGRWVIYGLGIVCTALYAFPYFGLLDTKSSGLVLLPSSCP